MNTKFKMAVNHRYVLATLASPTRYLRYMTNRKWLLVDDIWRASKTETKLDANDLLRCYHEDLPDAQEFAILPLIITYEVEREDDLIDADTLSEELKWGK